MRIYFRTLISASLLLTLFFSATLFTACKKKPAESIPVPELSVETKPHEWFYFTKTGSQPIDLPQNAPKILFTPWTESVRVSASAHISEAGYLLVNRQGLYRFSDTETQRPMQFYTDSALFLNTTADMLVSVNKTPVFHLYRNSFFNQSPATQTKVPFLVQFKPDSGFFIPALTAADIQMKPDSQPVSLSYDGNKWTASFKSEKENRVVFDYVSFFSYEPLLSISQSEKKYKIVVEPITEDEFKKNNEYRSFSQAPQAVKQLLTPIPKNIDLQVESSVPDGSDPLVWTRESGNSGATVFQAKVFIGDIFSLAVFSDGTAYFAGALPGKHVLKSGKTLAFRLPKLPPDFVYTYFTVSGTRLYAAWEETRFYETGRAGYISVDLGRVLYQ